MAADNDTSNFDRQHLQGVSPQLALQADLLLCATDGSQSVCFPVHKLVLSAHSPVLSDIFATLTAHTDKTGLPRLSMQEDNIAAVRNALAHIYHVFDLPSDHSSATPSMPALSLGDLPAYASYMEFCDKYDMAIVAQALLARSMPVLRNYLHAASLETTDLTKILDCTAAAHAYKLVPMLAMCEAIIIKHFPAFACNCETMTSKLSNASMLSIAKGLSKLKEQLYADMERYDARVQDVVSHCVPGAFGLLSCQESLKLNMGRNRHRGQQQKSLQAISNSVASVHNIPTAALGLS